MTDPPRASRKEWLALALAWATCLSVVLAWVLPTPVVALREQLKMLQFWSLSGCVALGLATGATALREIGRLINRRDTLMMAMPAALALALTVGMAPRTNRIYYDEQIYQNIAQNLAHLNRAQLCNDGAIVNGRLQCSAGEYNKQPYGYPYALSLAYRAFGVGTTPAFVFNAVVMGVSVCFVYLSVVVLFSDRAAALFAALLLALTPEQLVWSATAAVEPSAALACLAALLATACFVRTRSTTLLVGAAVATAYAIQFRPESLLIVPVVGLLLWQRAREEFTRPRIWWVGLLFVALVAVHLGHMAAVRNEGWGTTRERLSLAYAAANLRVNTWFYVADARFPAAYTLFALLGLTGRRTESGRMALVLYFVLFWGIVLLFYAGSYNYGADVRYSLATYAPLVILAGLGAARLARWIERVEPRMPVLQGLIFVLGIQFLWYLPVVRATSDSAWAPRADVEFAESLLPDLRGQTYVLTQNPGMFQVWGVSAGQMSLAAANPARLDDLTARYPGGVYLHWNFWCNVEDPVQRGFCTKVLGLRPSRPVRERDVQDEHYVLYRLASSAREP